jgi:hypothetical protein
MKTLTHAFVIASLFAGIITAGQRDPAAEAKMLQDAIAKEQRRATEAYEHHANRERFEKKFGWAKEKHQERFDAMMIANDKAATAWQAVVQKSQSITHPDDLSDEKLIASAAASEAYLAERALRFATSQSERTHMASKSDSEEVRQLAAKLDANEEQLLHAMQAKEKASLLEHKLAVENRTLNQALRSAYEEAREKAKQQHSNAPDRKH